MEIRVVGCGVKVDDTIRAHVDTKAAKLAVIAPRAITLEVRMRPSAGVRAAAAGERVELTLSGPGGLVRAEARATDMLSALDAAFARLVQRLRRAKEQRTSTRRRGAVPAPAGIATVVSGASGSVTTTPETGEAVDDDVPEADYCPVIIRRKTFASLPMTVDDALYYMELVGHDFYLFIDVDSGRPSVVYRRKGWDYGVIGLDENAEESQEANTWRRATAPTATA